MIQKVFLWRKTNCVFVRKYMCGRQRNCNFFRCILSKSFVGWEKLGPETQDINPITFWSKKVGSVRWLFCVRAYHLVNIGSLTNKHDNIGSFTNKHDGES